MINGEENKKLWTLRQIYHQSQLDTIHCYLCHTDWKDRVNRYIKRKKQEDGDSKENDNDEEDYELEEMDAVTTMADVNKSKYVTSSYGFGVDHRYALCLIENKSLMIAAIYIQSRSSAE